MNQDSGGDTTLTISAAALLREETCLQVLPAVVMPAPSDLDVLLIEFRALESNLTMFMNLFTECPRAFEFRTATEAAFYATYTTLSPTLPPAGSFTATATPTLTGEFISPSLGRACALKPALDADGLTIADAMDHIHRWQLFEALDDASRRHHPHRSHLTGRVRRALAAASDDLQRLVLVLLRSSKRRRKSLARIWKEPA